MKKPIRIGMIGTGLMGRIHSNGYNQVPHFFPEQTHTPVLQVVCSRNEAGVKAFAEQWGYAAHETDWRAVIARDDVDAIDICTPNNTHAASAASLPPTSNEKTFFEQQREELISEIAIVCPLPPPRTHEAQGVPALCSQPSRCVIGAKKQMSNGSS